MGLERPFGEVPNDFALDLGLTANVVRTLLRVVLATVTFLFFFYSTTMSMMYALDSAVLRF